MEKNPNSNKNKKKTKQKGSILDKVIIVFLALVLIGGVSVFGIFTKIVASVDTTNLEDRIVSKEPSDIYGIRNGKVELMGQMGGESRENITYEQIPQVTIDAFLAIEDSRFFKHNGFDMPRFISSAINNLKNGDLSQGGSTLTMQAIDNYIMKVEEEKLQQQGQYYNQLDKIVNKVKEIYLSMTLEKITSKEDILTAYLNQINFGQRARGIQKGAEYYFGKNVEELNLSESAFLAGVINAPNAYNPYNGVVIQKDEKGNEVSTVNYYQAAVERRNDTLYQMYNHGYITKEEYELTKSTKLAFQLNGSSSSAEDDSMVAIKLQIYNEVKKQTGVDPYTTPMKIYTSIDLDAQEQAIKICKGEGINTLDNKYFQLGFTMMNNQTGEIVAMGPGLNVDYASNNWNNLATDYHQPGSSIKPIIDYALTFDKLGWSTAHSLKDEAIDMGGITLQNADGKYRGEVSLEQAVTESLNPPAIKALKGLIEKIGVNGVVDYLKNIGFTAETITTDNFDLGFGIGGSKLEVSTVEMAAAYASFANGGNYIQPHMVTKVEFKDGNKTVIPQYEKTQVMSEQAAYMMSDLLNKAVSGKYSVQGAFLRDMMDSSYTVYGKTGTTNWGANDYGYNDLDMKDNWMIGYTSNYVVATWTGFDTKNGAHTGLTKMDINDLLRTRTAGNVNKLMLKTVASGDGPIARPSGLTDVSLVKGAYPYMSAPKDSKEAISGLIKTEHAKDIKSATITPPDNLSNFIVTKANANGTDIEFTFSAYPGDKESDMIKWFGEIVYRVTIKVDGSVIKNETFTSPSGTITAAIPEGKTATICGFYQYKDSKDDKAKSNEICTEISTESSINKTSLQTMISTASSLTSTDYTPDSWSSLQSVLANAKLVLDKSDATQAEIDSAAQAVQTAVQSLVKAPAQ